MVFGADPRRPLQHLGEAETLVVIEYRPQYAGSVWVTDDSEAGRYAARRGITVRDTVDIMRIAVVDGLLAAAEGHRLLLAMTATDRHVRGIPSRPEDLLR